ncbi:hypothetical protein [Phosphitispora sp. TUW77]|uniref:hypothetical protein n=1 Tax=Phosphitispora sp. TUW77 TaxID=3152361 RepID=UPI003AB800AA
MKEIKSKQTLKDIKVLDKTTDVSRRAKNAYIRTKEQAEQLGHNENGNYVDDATNSVRDGAQNIAWKVGHTAENYGKKAVEKMCERRASMGKQAAKLEIKYKPAQSSTKETAKRRFTLSKPNELIKRRFVQSRAKLRLTHNIEIQTADQKVVFTQARQASGRIIAPTTQSPFFQPVEKVVRQTFNPSSTTGRPISQAVNSGSKTIKEAAKGTVKTAQKSVKNAKHTAKTAVKTSQTAAKTAVKTARAAQRAAQAAQATARAAAVSAKTAAKAIIATLKAIIAAAKSLISLIAAGGWVAVVVILVICLAGLLLGSVFGIFYSNESPSGNTPVMMEVVKQLNSEFAAKIEQIEEENPHDTLDLSNNGSSTMVGNWRDILAVYAVKVAADPRNGMEVATLDDDKVGTLRDIFWDMNKIEYWTETVVRGETVTIILHIKVTSKSYSDMIAKCGFNEEQVKMLNELMKDKYRQLFMQLTGS